MRTPAICLIGLLAAGMLTAGGGCAETSLFKGGAKVETATPQEPAVNALSVWQPARGRGPNGMPTRGVAGQLMFFTGRNPSPVAVDGDVRIYLFDNLGTAAEQAKPIHQFDFPAETWQAHLRSGNLGPTYHVFVPYVRGGFEQVECALQVRFTPKEGPVVYSEMTSLVLPGTVDMQEPEPALALNRTRTSKTGQTADAPPSANKPSLAVHTIRPQDLSRRNQAGKTSAGIPAIVDHAVQQASATTEPNPELAGRLDRLERMLTQLAEPSTVAVPASSPATHPLAEPAQQPAPEHPLANAGPAAAPPRRFRLQPAPGAESHPLVEREEQVWLEPPMRHAPHPLHDGIGTTQYPDWVPLELHSERTGHPLVSE